MVLGERSHICMDEAVWGRLPEELVDAVLACLPVSHLLRLRAVCKRWNGLLSCPRFLHLWSQVPQKRYYFLFNGLNFVDQFIDAGLIFCLTSNRWYRLPLDFLPFPWENIMDITGGGGLLLVCSVSTSVQMVVVNPVTKAWRILPTFNRSFCKPSLAALVVNKSKATYTIVAAFDSDMTTYVYESSTNVWTNTAQLPFHTTMRPVVCNSIMYCMHLEDTTRIGAYHIEKGQWSIFNVLSGAQLRFMESLFDPLEHAQLVESCGRLLLITRIQELQPPAFMTKNLLVATGMLSTDQASAPTGAIHVWEVQPELQKSELVVQMPENLKTHFQDGFHVFAFHNAEHEEALLFIAWDPTSSSVSLSPYSLERTSTLLYDLVENTWEWTRSPQFSEFLPEFELTGFPMELSLTLLP